MSRGTLSPRFETSLRLLTRGVDSGPWNVFVRGKRFWELSQPGFCNDCINFLGNSDVLCLSY